jgi:hypothetical protein
VVHGPKLDFVEVAVVRIERVVGLFVGPIRHKGLLSRCLASALLTLDDPARRDAMRLMKRTARRRRCWKLAPPSSSRSAAPQKGGKQDH